MILQKILQSESKKVSQGNLNFFNILIHILFLLNGRKGFIKEVVLRVKAIYVEKVILPLFLYSISLR